MTNDIASSMLLIAMGVHFVNFSMDRGYCDTITEMEKCLNHALSQIAIPWFTLKCDIANQSIFYSQHVSSARFSNLHHRDLQILFK